MRLKKWWENFWKYFLLCGGVLSTFRIFWELFSYEPFRFRGLCGKISQKFIAMTNTENILTFDTFVSVITIIWAIGVTFWFIWWIIERLINRFIPLKKAALMAYDINRKSGDMIGQVIEKLIRHRENTQEAITDEILQHYARRLMKEGVIFGKRIPSDILEEIPKRVRDSGILSPEFDGDITFLQTNLDFDRVRYTELCIKKNDLRKVLGNIEKGSMKYVNQETI